MASWSGLWRSGRTSLDRRRKGYMHSPFGPRHADLSPRLSDVSATANALEADATADGRAEIGVSRAYVHWHDPDTVTIHPFKDTPLGDAA